MPRRRTGRNAYRNIERIAGERAFEIADRIVEIIHDIAPYDESEASKPEHLHLRSSYYVARNPDGTASIRCRRRYWVYVEFGTRKHNREDAQPHVGPSRDLAKAELAAGLI